MRGQNQRPDDQNQSQRFWKTQKTYRETQDAMGKDLENFMALLEYGRRKKGGPW